MERNGVPRPSSVDYRKICTKLAQGRSLVYIGYYVGRLNTEAPGYGQQRAFFHRLEQQSIHIVPGRIEKRPIKNAISDKVDNLLMWLTNNVKSQLALPLYNILRQQVSNLVLGDVWVEKAVDVHLAVDIISKAHMNEYDIVYLLSADGDYTPAVQEVKQFGKTVFAVSPAHGNELSKVVDTYIKLKVDWFHDCYRDN